MCHHNFMVLQAWEILREVCYFSGKLLSLSAHLISPREAKRRKEEGTVDENQKKYREDCFSGLLFLCWVFLCLFEPFAIKDEEQETSDVDAFWLKSVYWCLEGPLEVYFCFLFPSSELLHHCFPLTLLARFFSLSLSSPMVPVRRLSPTANASPPFSERIRQLPSTTPPGCSFSRSGSGHALPPSSRPPKSSPQSVLFMSPMILHLSSTVGAFSPSLTHPYSVVLHLQIKLEFI